MATMGSRPRKRKLQSPRTPSPSPATTPKAEHLLQKKRKTSKAKKEFTIVRMESTFGGGKRMLKMATAQPMLISTMFNFCNDDSIDANL